MSLMLYEVDIWSIHIKHIYEAHLRSTFTKHIYEAHLRSTHTKHTYKAHTRSTHMKHTYGFICMLQVRICACTSYKDAFHTHQLSAAWRRCIRCAKSQVFLRNRPTNYMALLRKMTCRDKASCAASPPCLYMQYCIYKRTHVYLWN